MIYLKNIKFEFLVNRHAIKGLGIGFALTTFNQLTGNFTITSYAVMIFAKTKTTLNPHISSIILAVSLLVGSIFTSYLADKLGRKILNLISLTGSAIGLFTISLYQYFNVNGYDMSAFEWVPVICLSFVIFISSAGIFALSLVCSIEYLPTKVRYILSDPKTIFQFYEHLHLNYLIVDSDIWILNHLLLD